MFHRIMKYCKKHIFRNKKIQLVVIVEYAEYHVVINHQELNLNSNSWLIEVWFDLKFFLKKIVICICHISGVIQFDYFEL